MVSMLLKMTGVTVLYVLLTMLLWTRLKGKKLGLGGKLGIGLIYGIASVLSTHFGIDYGHMLLNVRDLGPMSAGLFFDPVSGVVAGLIGGVERYIAGTYWGVGSYTRIACSVSTCLAGFVAAAMNVYIFKRKKPSEAFALFMGAVMEVFHMYVVFITHRDDMKMAFYVVRICSMPMIAFTGLGLAASSMAIRILSGEWRNPFKPRKEEETPVSRRFQFWLFAVSMAILLVNSVFTFMIQSEKAVQAARQTLTDVAGDIQETYDKVRATQDGVQALAEDTLLADTRSIAELATTALSVDMLDGDFLEQVRQAYDLVAVSYLSRDGAVKLTAGDSPVYTGLLADTLSGASHSQVVKLSGQRIIAGVALEAGMIQAVIDTKELMSTLKISGLSDTLSSFHVGSEGTLELLQPSGIIQAGSHRGKALSSELLQMVMAQPHDVCFDATLFDVESMCMTRDLDDDVTLLVTLPYSEVYESRDMQIYETVMADVLLLAVIYVLISSLVQGIVVNNLELVNKSLDRITGGNLDERVNVRKSSEFASLSDDINQTVGVLKQYIAAAEKRIEQELELARTIQDSALPKNFNFPRNDFELYAMMDPAKEVGGDFYDFFFVDRDRLALVIADVSGKGIPASLFMMRSKTAIRSLAESVSDISEILYRANNALCEGNDAEMFVTAWIGVIDLTTGLMRCANAGHEFPALMRAGGEFELLRDRHGLALAAMENMRYKEYELQLNPGDRLFVYTDGVPEAIDGNVEQYGTERMLKSLNAQKDRPMAQILPATRQDIEDFAGGVDQFDDITMIGFTFNGPTGKGEDHEGMDV